MSKEESTQPIDDIKNYFSSLSAICYLRKQINRMTDLDTIYQAECKLDKIIEVRWLTKSCNKFFHKVLCDFTYREIEFMRRYYYCKEPLKEIAIQFRYEYQNILSMQKRTYNKLRHIYGLIR